MNQEQTHSYQEFEVEVGWEDLEPVTNYIIENLASGLILEDNDGSARTLIRFYAASELDVDDKLVDLRDFLIRINPKYHNLTIRQKEIINRDWIESYQKAATAVFVGESVVVKPPWDKNDYAGKIQILLEPKMAFGTGRHETSRSCLAELENLNLTGKTMLDLGCGSGILGIMGALKGAAAVTALDNDPLAVENSRGNYLLNGTDSVCRVIYGTIDELPAGSQFDMIVVNIVKAVILPIMDKLKSLIRPGGYLILSGLLDQDTWETERVLTANDLTDFRVRCDGEWRTYTIQL